MVRHRQLCQTCGWQDEILVRPGHDPYCPRCGLGWTTRLWTSSASVISDALPGGAQWIENLDHRPIWVETKTQLRRELDARGLTQKVQHRTSPDSDKSAFTSRWI